MSVKDYYYAHFDEMSLEKRKHFATRMKYWFNDSYFDAFLSANEPSHDIAEVLADNDYSGVNDIAIRRPFFEKYPELYGLEATLFRLNRLIIEYNIDLREDFLKLFPRKKLYDFCDKLLQDNEALDALTTYAVNTICLTHNLFPRDKDIYEELTNYYLNCDQKPGFIYAYTHIILCMSDFYTKKVTGKKWDLASRMLAKCEQLIEDFFDEITMDAKLEFLVCCRINKERFDYEPVYTYATINKECKETLKESPFVTDGRKSQKYNTLDGAEHRNVLYIMSGLDY